MCSIERRASRQFRRPVGADDIETQTFHGLRDAENGVAPPVATFRGPVGAKESDTATTSQMRFSHSAKVTRTEALNVIRNRKGGTPRIVVVTMEPLPSRLASIAMGTGDIDCCYHAALEELMQGAKTFDLAGSEAEILKMLITGSRLRDISDLPFDLAV